jgi:hypothetical protein
MKTKQILNLPLSKLTLTPQARNTLTRRVLEIKHPDWKKLIVVDESKPFWSWEYARKEKKEIKKWHSKVTVIEVMEMWDGGPEHRGFSTMTHNRFGSHRTYQDTAMRVFIKELERLRLTKLDWVQLGDHTVPPLSKLTKKQWLKKSILLLGTINYHGLNELGYENQGKNLKDITVGDLLQFSPYYFRRSRCSADKTVLKLREIGFTEKDGRFMTRVVVDKREKVEKILIEEGIEPSLAKQAIEVLFRRNLLR